MMGLSFGPQSCYSGSHLRLMCSRHGCDILDIVQAHNEVPVENSRSAALFPDHTQSSKFWAAVLANVLMVAPKTCLATSIAALIGGYVPLLLGHLGNAQASLLEYLHVLQNATIFCEFLQLLEADHLGELLNELDMYKTPLRLLAV